MSISILSLALKMLLQVSFGLVSRDGWMTMSDGITDGLL
jgi:hypothetical protein